MNFVLLMTIYFDFLSIQNVLLFLLLNCCCCCCCDRFHTPSGYYFIFCIHINIYKLSTAKYTNAHRVCMPTHWQIYHISEWIRLLFFFLLLTHSVRWIVLSTDYYGCLVLWTPALIISISCHSFIHLFFISLASVRECERSRAKRMNRVQSLPWHHIYILYHLTCLLLLLCSL